MPEIITKLKKYLFVFLITFSTCVLLGYMIELIFDIKIYQSLFMGAAIATTMGHQAGKRKTVKKQ